MGGWADDQEPALRWKHWGFWGFESSDATNESMMKREIRVQNTDQGEL